MTEERELRFMIMLRRALLSIAKWIEKEYKLTADS